MKPMLLCRENPDVYLLQYPVWVSVKLDGIRCIIKDGVALSRTLKPIPNKYVQQLLGFNNYNGFDGELIVGKLNAPNVYRTTNSIVMSHDKEVPFDYYVFDLWNSKSTYKSRYEELESYDYDDNLPPFIKILPGRVVFDVESLLKFEEQALNEGYEGIIIRNLKGMYRFGRTTMKENNTYKLKRFEDAEAEIIGFEEELHNGNPAEVNELGRTKRSVSKAGLSGKGTLGAFILRTPDGVDFRCGSGFDAQDRQAFWDTKDDLLGKIVKYKFFPVGIKDKPRHPIFLGFRSKDDM